MFEEETVFILGAGASWHYGYPTGETLVKHIQERAVDLIGSWQNLDPNTINEKPPKYFIHLAKDLGNDLTKGFTKFLDKCRDISDRLKQVNPLVIDYFLDKNKSLRSIGKLLIGLEMLACELKYKNYQGGNYNRILSMRESADRDECLRAAQMDPRKFDDDWLRFVLDKIISACEDSGTLLLNKITFITFNYDVSLERRLYEGLSPIEYFTDAHKKTFFERKDLVLHIYGKIREFAFENKIFGSFREVNDALPDKYSAYVENLDQAWIAAQSIHTISEDKENNSALIKKAQEKIAAAKNVFLLGFGFDENNSERLNLKKVLDLMKESGSLPKRISFTNYKDSNRINKRASRLFFHADDIFLGRSIPPQTLDSAPTGIMNYGEIKMRGWHHEKSVKNVYDALAYDFELSLGQ